MPGSTSSTSRAQARSDHRSGVLGSRATQAVRARRCRQGAAGDRGGAPDRRDLRYRARDQRSLPAQRHAMRQVRDLHLVLQAVRWAGPTAISTSSGPRHRLGVPDPDFGDGPLDARKARLIDAWRTSALDRSKTSTISATAGNTSIRIERIADAVPGIAYPRLIEAPGRCRPRRMSAVPGVTATSSKRSPIQTTSSRPRERDMGRRKLRSRRPRYQGAGDDLAALAKRWSRAPTPKLEAIHLTRGPHRMDTLTRTTRWSIQRRPTRRGRRPPQRCRMARQDAQAGRAWVRRSIASCGLPCRNNTSRSDHRLYNVNRRGM